MSFIVRCPFCKSEMECPDDLLGKVGVCVSCGREIDLDDDRPAAPGEDPNAQAVRTMRAAALAAMPSEMPRVTWSWAFEAVLKITVAAAVIDGALSALIWMTIRLFSRR